MKKQFLTFAVLAAGLLVAACGGKTSKGDSQTTDEVRDAPANISGITNTVEHALFSVGLPNGWRTLSTDDPETPSVMVFKGNNEMNLANSGFLMFNLEKKADKSLEQSMAEFEKQSYAKRIDDVTIGGITWNGYEITEGEVTGKILVTEMKGYFVTATITMMELDNADVKAIIQSFQIN